MQNATPNLRPIKRGKLRLFCGRAAYTMARYGLWASGRYKFAKKQQQTPLPYQWAAHATPLLRQLKDVDMQYQYNKIINLKLAVQQINGLVLGPGQTFSYWKCIGKPTARKGYVNGMVLHYGSFGPGIGGGLCQLSNLLFWISIHTPLTVVERYRHSFDVFPDAGRTQPFGSGATCVYPYRDLMVRNDTSEAFQLLVQVGSQNLQGEWRSSAPPTCQYKITEYNHRMQREYWGGFSRHNQLYRQQFSLEGDLLNEEFLTENHALMMYSPFLEGGVCREKE
ncbi:VanW family protein [Ruminococcaceae bacterium OttesenSCG-928-A16]|nr:VanW family protein [Ruminococcaceae bacterium OttesenSCG-928-A16]